MVGRGSFFKKEVVQNQEEDQKRSIELWEELPPTAGL